MLCFAQGPGSFGVLRCSLSALGWSFASPSRTKAGTGQGQGLQGCWHPGGSWWWWDRPRSAWEQIPGTSQEGDRGRGYHSDRWWWDCWVHGWEEHGWGKGDHNCKWGEFEWCFQDHGWEEHGWERRPQLQMGEFEWSFTATASSSQSWCTCEHRWCLEPTWLPPLGPYDLPGLPNALRAPPSSLDQCNARLDILQRLTFLLAYYIYYICYNILIMFFQHIEIFVLAVPLLLGPLPGKLWSKSKRWEAQSPVLRPHQIQALCKHFRMMLKKHLNSLRLPRPRRLLTPRLHLTLSTSSTSRWLSVLGGKWKPLPTKRTWPLLKMTWWTRTMMFSPSSFKAVFQSQLNIAVSLLMFPWACLLFPYLQLMTPLCLRRWLRVWWLTLRLTSPSWRL